MSENPFVTYLDQFNVLSPNHAKIYDEYTHDDSSQEYNFNFTIPTKVEQFLLDVFTNSPRSIILTGNAGDGKTRLCRRVHDAFSSEPLKDWPNEGIVEVPFSHGRIRILKDLSELKDDIIFRELSRLQNYINTNHTENTYYLIAANEGKLTKFLSRNNEFQELGKEVKLRFESHLNNTDDFSIINLLDVTSSVYVERVLEEWNKEENWTPCNGCAKKNRCVIYHNHIKTSRKDVQKKLVEQYRLLDFLETHITMREMLIHISYMLTGGYTCKDIRDADWRELEDQTKKVYYQNFYGLEAHKDAFNEMYALKVFKTLDPGNYSHSRIDDFIINGDISGDSSLAKTHEELFNNELDLQFGFFSKRLRIYRDHNKDNSDTFISEWIHKLRRKVFFEVTDGELIDTNQLLPFEYVSEYSSMFNNQQKQTHIKRGLINGLNRAFSNRLVKNGKSLYATTENLMIYDSYRNKQVKIEEEEERKDIDYIPSRFVLNVDEKKLTLNLSLFEYLIRLNGGGTHNILQQEVDILIETFKNELIKDSEPEEYTLNLLRLDKRLGLFIEDEIDLP
ncbi:ATP-binding protein [Oceanobacillus halotolerans]|uniref:ATP-binding protein n=1 Tax=Oceanobacillus halotolerans TaxID=2663380 RepID=UPI0013DAD07E|nr:ATP-binding protein [Oceanobacillus halotolerans]